MRPQPLYLDCGRFRCGGFAPRDRFIDRSKAHLRCMDDLNQKVFTSHAFPQLYKRPPL